MYDRFYRLVRSLGDLRFTVERGGCIFSCIVDPKNRELIFGNFYDFVEKMWEIVFGDFRDFLLGIFGNFTKIY